MSLKSQKSLNEDNSEIFEKSYSAGSVSEESLSCDNEDDDDSLALELMKKLTPGALSKLRRCFKKSKERVKTLDVDRRVEEVMRRAAAEEGIEFAAPTHRAEDDGLCLGETAFVGALDNIFGNHKFTTHSHKLFRVLDPFRTGRVRWRAVVDRLAAAGGKATASRLHSWPRLTATHIKKLAHCKRETIVKLVNIEKEDSFCYAAVSKGGRIGIYSGEMKLLYSYEMFHHRTGLKRRVKNCWITDALYLTDVQCLILSASDRSLTIYDASTLTHSPLYCITGIPNIPTCMSYSPSESPGAPSELAFGTDRGEIVRVRFLQPRVALFHTTSADHINYYFWMELTGPPHNAYCALSRSRAHARCVRRVLSERTLTVSCAHDGDASVRVRHRNVILDDCVMGAQRGVTCFFSVRALQLLVTGSADGTVRLWERWQRAPYAALVASRASILDVVVVLHLQIIVAYNNQCVVYIWDLFEECLLQSFKIKFPFFGSLGKKADFGSYSIYPGAARAKVKEESDPEVLETSSRRGSSVLQAASGGLLLQPDKQTDEWLRTPLEQDPEYIRFNRPDVVVTCCDYICVLRLSTHEADRSQNVLLPPADTLRARTPAGWDLPQTIFVRPSARSRPSSPLPPTTSLSPPSLPPLVPPPATSLSPPSIPPLPPPPATFLSPSTAEFPHHDLDQLLHNAGLEGILEKDFVLMQGLKHDLNKRLADLQANMDVMVGAVASGAPYLSLRTLTAPQPPQVDEMTDVYHRIMKLFPGPSVSGTPVYSESSTPRRSRHSGSVKSASNTN